MLRMQLSRDPYSSETLIQAAEHHFSSHSTSNNGIPVNSVFRFEVNDSYAKSHEINPKTNPVNSLQPQKQAETHFSAFSPTFQIPVNSKTTSTDQKRLITQSKPTQNPLKMEKTSPTNNKITSNNAQQTQKTSENSQKAADQKSTVPARISSPKYSPPPVKQGQKIIFNSQIKQTTTGNIALAAATPATHSFCPVSISQNKNSRSNSTTEVNSAVFPDAPAAATLYDVVSTANACDYKVTACGAVGKAAKQNTDFTPLEKPPTYSAAKVIPSLSFYSSLFPKSKESRTTPQQSNQNILHESTLEKSLKPNDNISLSVQDTRSIITLDNSPQNVTQDFTALNTILPHPSALEMSQTTPKASKSLDDLPSSQFYEQQPIFHAAKIKDSIHEIPNRPKKQRNIIKATEPDAISDLTKFFYFTTEKETASIVNRTCKAPFNSIPSIQYHNYKVHSSPTDDKTEPSLTDNTSVLAKSTVYAPTTHQTKNSVQEIKSSSRNQHQPKTKEPTSSRFNKGYKAYPDLHNNMHYVRKNASQQTNTKIILRKPSAALQMEPPNETPIQDEITPTNFPALPSQKNVSKHQSRDSSHQHAPSQINVSSKNKQKIPTSRAEQDEVEISPNSAKNSRNQIIESYANLTQSLDERFETLLAAIKSRNNLSK